LIENYSVYIQTEFNKKFYMYYLLVLKYGK
jgi:hypothetical protein